MCMCVCVCVCVCVIFSILRKPQAPETNGIAYDSQVPAMGVVSTAHCTVGVVRVVPIADQHIVLWVWLGWFPLHLYCGCG